MKYGLLILSTILINTVFGAQNRLDPPGALRVNRIGYLEDDIKVGVYLGNDSLENINFIIVGPNGKESVDSVVASAAWEPFSTSARIYFSSLSQPGEYNLIAENVGGEIVDEISVYIGNDAYSRHKLHELPLGYLRQQRCGYNPVHDQNCHMLDGRLVLSGERDGEKVTVWGGWHDASDYLQYLPTTATTVYQLLFAYEQNPGIWQDEYDDLGRPGVNGIPDILDEAKWGLDWLKKMNPELGFYLNQIADDRDHKYVGVPSKDNVDYGWGEGNERPVYPCSGTPYGLGKYKNESTGLASSVAKFASAFFIGSRIFKEYFKLYSEDLEERGVDALRTALENPGACQTAPCVSPYYYEEDNWNDDVELAIIEFYRTLGDSVYIENTRWRAQNAEFLAKANIGGALENARKEPVTPWMGADNADHYQWYPFINLGHYMIGSTEQMNDSTRAEVTDYMRQGLERVVKRGQDNVFLNGIPFIWCSNNLASAFVTQGMLYRELTGDKSYLEAETMVRDWLFGLNPWDQMMIIMPKDLGPSPLDPHSAMTDLEIQGIPGRDWLIGGLVDGPIYAERFNSLWGVHLRNNDPYADIQNPTVVYHDDYSDYSTNEPTMDGSASVTFLLGRLTSAANK